MQIAVPFIIHRGQDIHDLLSLFQVAKLDTRLDYVTGEFVLRVVDEVGRDERDDPVSILLSAMLDDMLCDVVAILIADEVLCATVELLKNCRPSRLDTMFQHALDDPTAIRMLRKLVDLAGKSIDDELYMLCRYTLNCLLYDMIPILIFDASHDLLVLLELADE